MRRVLISLGILAALFVAWLLVVWPPPSWYRTHWPRQTAFMTRAHPAPRSAKASARGRLYQPVPLDSIVPEMQDAVIIGEDNNFRTHHGIDYLALAHALGYRPDKFSWHDAHQRRELLAVLPNAWSRRDQLRGASTITQQLAKNLYLSPSRNPLRKLKEAVTAWRLEWALGKPRIMELYLNIVELGEDVWGVEAASRLYFRRSASQISAEQAAALAGALPFPLRSNPDYRPGRMQWRQNLILRRLRGEQVEVPRPVEEEEVVPAETPPYDSLAPELSDTLAPDTTAPAADSSSPNSTLPPAVPDSGPVPEASSPDSAR
jgi:monofunctional biosynthetic peptidoglycan transglycosylase